MTAVSDSESTFRDAFTVSCLFIAGCVLLYEGAIRADHESVNHANAKLTQCHCEKHIGRSA